MANLIRLDNGQTYSLKKENVIGRLSAADVCVNDVSVSRHHAQINMIADGNFQLVDMASVNGIFINGSKVSKGTVKTGDKLTIGKVDLIFSDDLRANTSQAPTQSAGQKTIALGSTPIVKDVLNRPQATRRSSASSAYAIKPRGQQEEYIELNPSASINSAIHDEFSSSWLKKIVLTNLAVNAAKNEMEVYEVLTEALQDAIHCSQIYLTVIKENAENNIALALGDNDSARMSSDLMRKTLNDGYSFMIRNTANPTLADSHILLRNGVRSVLTAPLLNSQKQPIGFIYIDSQLEQAINDTEFAFARIICMHAGLLLCKLFNTSGSVGPGLRKNNILPGSSDYVKSIMKKIELYSSLDAPVLIQGVKGNDFLAIATVIHENSSRGKRRLLSINCEDAGQNLHDELFDKTGKIYQAQQGSLLIENFDSLDLNSQKKLYSFMSTGKLNPRDTRNTDTRLICTTKLDFNEAVNRGLIYPLFSEIFESGKIQLHPISSHQEDLREIVEHYFLEARKESSNKGIQLESNAYEAFLNCSGNETELAFILKFAVMKAQSETISKETLEKFI